MRMLIPLALAALITLAPSAVQAQDDKPACPGGQVETPEGCSQQAWVDDCPPDHRCAAASDDPDAPQSYGPEDCIECSGPVDATDSDPQTCMDGTDEGEACDDVMDFGGGPADSGVSPEKEDEDVSPDPASKDTPATSAVLLLAALVGVLLLVRRG